MVLIGKGVDVDYNAVLKRSPPKTGVMSPIKSPCRLDVRARDQTA